MNLNSYKESVDSQIINQTEPHSISAQIIGDKFKELADLSITINNAVIFPEYFGAVGDGITDDTVAIQAAIDSIPNASSGYFSLRSGKTYRITSSINIFNKNLLFDGANATIDMISNSDNLLYINSSKCEVRNLTLTKASNVKVNAAIFVTGIEIVFNNISSRDQKFTNFFYLQDLKESHFSNIRVDLDVQNRTGTIFLLEYSVNNTFTDSMIGYCDKAFYGLLTTQPLYSYKVEGITISNVITVYANQACNFDFVTFLAISNCIFDFCQNNGIYCSNGQDLKIVNTWIASNTADGFLSIGTTPNFDDVSVIGCTLMKTFSSTTASAFGLSGTNSKAIGNMMKNGIDGGAITKGAIVGNSYAGNGVPLNYGGSSTLIEGNLTVNTLTVTGETIIKATGLAGSATSGVNSTVPSNVAGFIKVSIAGKDQMIPYFNL